MLVSDACGCTLAYSSNLPTNPWAKDDNGKGVAFSASLFEDNAEFGFGYRLSADFHRHYAYDLLQELENEIGKDLVEQIINAKQTTVTEIAGQRKRVIELKAKLKLSANSKAKELTAIADQLINHSVWAIGGDGWAYDIGYGGLDHVIATGRNVNI
jgi:pyruvate-ferredoxin/flavodoxin oxidoreductase